MEQSASPEMNKVLYMIARHRLESRTGAYQHALREESKKDRHLSTEAKMLSLEQLALRHLGVQPLVQHPRILTLLMQEDMEFAQQQFGTPPVTPLHAQGRLLPRHLQAHHAFQD